jgi:hypothetical protein
MSDIIVADDELFWEKVLMYWTGEVILSGDVFSELLPIVPPQDTGDMMTPISESSLTETGDEMSLIPQDSESTQMQSFALMISSTPQITITEVRIDGTDEYVELTNQGDPFVWTISLSWIKVWLLTVSLDLWTNESVVIGDTLAMVIQSWFDVISSQWLSITDTAARMIEVLYDGTTIDTLTLTSSQVVWSDNLSASREYDAEAHLRQVTPTTHNANIGSSHRGNPWLVRWLTLFWASTWTVTTWTVTTWTVTTWTVTTWINTTWSLSTWTLTWFTSITWIIQITQVYPFTDCIGEHLALTFAAPYSWNLTIQWLGTSDTSKTFAIQVNQPWLRYIVESLSGILSDNVVLVPSITLTDAGESLTVLDASGVILDMITYSSTQSARASIFTTISWEMRLFATNQDPLIPSSCTQSIQTPQVWWCRIQMTDPVYVTWVFASLISVSWSLVTPWCSSSSWSVDGQLTTTDSCSLTSSFTAWSHRIVYQQYSGTSLICEDEIMFYGAIQQQIITNTTYITGETITITPVQHSCSIGTQNQTPFGVGNSVNLVAILDGTQLSNSSRYVCNWSGTLFSWSDDCNPTYFKLTQPQLIPLSLTIQNQSWEVICQTQSILNYPSQWGWWGSCGWSSTYYKWLYTLHKDRFNALKAQILAQWWYLDANDLIVDIKPNVINPSKQLPTEYHEAWFLEIVDIVVDPKGQWLSQESITILNNQLWEQSLSGMSIFINGKRAKNLTGTIYPWANYEIKANFSFPNKWWCVILANRAWIWDEICYGSGARQTQGDDDMIDTGSVDDDIEPMTLSKPKELFTATQCTKIEEYQLLELDIKEQKLINKAQRENYRKTINIIYDTYRARSDTLYHTYRDITDKKQAYIDSQQAYITKLQTQLAESRAYATDITKLYRSLKAYNQTLSERNTQCQTNQNYVKQNYPAIYQDPQLDPTIITSSQPVPIEPQQAQADDEQTRRSAANDTISNLFS